MRSYPQVLIATILLASCGGEVANTTPTTSTVVVTTTVAATTTTTEAPTTTTVPPTTTTTVPDALVCRDADCVDSTFDYLIVTRPMFDDALRPFVGWKTADGFRVGLVTVEWLVATYPGDHVAEQMKTGMHDLRTRAGVQWALLVGDTDMTAWDFSIDNVLDSYELETPWNVPTGFYRRLDTDPAGEVLPSDAYFTEDRDWDPGSTGLNPRPDNMATGEGTLDSTLFVGRWPVFYPQQIVWLTDKTMAASTATEILFTADSTLTDGTRTWCTSWPPTPFHFFSCYLDTMVTARNTFFEAAAPTLTTASRFVDVTDASATAEMQEVFFGAEGAIVASYHGNYQCWALGAECLTESQIEFDHVFPLLEAEACLIGTFYFDQGESLSESMLLAPTGPAVFTQAPNPTLFLRDLREGMSVGEAFWGTADEWLYWPNPITLLGDPSMVVFATP